MNLPQPNRRHVLTSFAAGPFLAAMGMPLRAQGLQKLNLIVGTSPPDPACHYLYYARDKGFFKDAGIDIEISGVTSATNATRAVVAGVADVGWVDSSSPLLARDSGAKIRCLAGFAAKLDYQIVGSKDIASMTGLAGKRFGVATIGGGTFIIRRAMIEKAGGKPDDTQWVAIGNSSARVQALIADKIATITTTSFVPKLMSYGRYTRIADAGAILPNMVYCWEITSDKALADKRTALAGFIAATAKAVRWAEANPDEAAALSMALLPDAPKDEITTGIKTYLAQHFWNAKANVTREQVEFTAETLRKSGQISKPFSYEDFVVPGLTPT